MAKKFKPLKVLLWFTPLLISLGIQQFIASSVTIAGASMAPSLQDGTRLVMSKLDRIYERGEIIVFSAAENDPTATSGESFYIKRIITCSKS